MQIRSFYRTIELSQGFGGHLATTEGFFYGLDTYPLFLAIAVYIPFWPSQFIGNASRNVTDSTQQNSVEMEEQRSEPDRKSDTPDVSDELGSRKSLPLSGKD
jgi:hypothetical protein